MLIIGIDPGASGGIAFNNGTAPYAHKMPETEADLKELLLSETSAPCFAYLELVHAMPKQGVTSSFNFGRNYGFIRGILIGMEIPFEDVRPQQWQKMMGCMTKGDKNVSKQKAQQLFPGLTGITHFMADALLIAEYGRRLRAGEFSK